MPLTQHDIGQRSDDVNLTPMLDVVFILLIFFVVTASFINETGIDIHSSRPSEKVLDPEAVILIAISDDNQIWLGRRLIDPRALRANIERLRTEFPAGTFVIQAGKQSHNKLLVEVMDAARQAGEYDITVAKVAR